MQARCAWHCGARFGVAISGVVHALPQTVHPCQTCFANSPHGAGRDAAMASARQNDQGLFVQKHRRALPRFHAGVEVRGAAERATGPCDAGCQQHLACSCPETYCLMLSLEWNFAGYTALQCTALWPKIARAIGSRRRRLQGGASAVCEGLRVDIVVPKRCSRPGCSTPEAKAPRRPTVPRMRAVVRPVTDGALGSCSDFFWRDACC